MAHSQILLLLAIHWRHEHPMIILPTFKDLTTHSCTANSWWHCPVQNGIHTSCLSESSNIGLGYFRQTADIDKEEHTNRFIVQDLVEGHFTFINTYQCWKATSWHSLVKQNIDVAKFIIVVRSGSEFQTGKHDLAWITKSLWSISIRWLYFPESEIWDEELGNSSGILYMIEIHTSCRSESSNFKLGRIRQIWKPKIWLAQIFIYFW